MSRQRAKLMSTSIFSGPAQFVREIVSARVIRRSSGAVKFSGLRGVSEVTIVAVEVGSAKGRKSHLGIGNRALTVELDITVNHRVLPDGLSRAMALPRFHGFVVCPAPAGNPGKKLQHQQISGFGHDLPRIFKRSILFLAQCNTNLTAKKSEARGGLSRAFHAGGTD